MHDYSFSALLGQRAFLRLWVARLFGTSGNQMLMVALGWHMYDLTRSAWDLGLVGLFQFLPALLLTLVAGHVVDRFHRARIVAMCMVVLVLVASTLLWATAGQWASRELLLGLSLALGTVRAFQMPAQQALTPLLVPTGMLPRAMAFSAAGMQTAIIAGPAIGGLIYSLSAVAVYGTCLALFFVAGTLLMRLDYDHQPSPPEEVTLQTVFAGVSFVWTRKVILGAVSLDLFAVLLGGATALLPIFARDLLQVGPSGLGFLRAAPAVGALAMSILLSRHPLARQVGPRLLSAVAVYGVCMLVFGASRSFWVSLVALAVSGAADMVSVVVRQSLVQLDTPDEMRGRVAAVNSIFIGASNQLGEFESGATAALFGPVGSVILGGVGTLAVAALWWRWFPELSKRDRFEVANPVTTPT